MTAKKNVVTGAVYVGGVRYLPGDEVAPEHVALITNPKLWKEQPEDYSAGNAAVGPTAFPDGSTVAINGSDGDPDASITEGTGRTSGRRR